MCGRYTVFSTYAEMQAHFGLENNINFAPSYNAAPTQQLPIVLGNQIRLASWGYVPEWPRGKGIKPQINARSETAAKKPYFRQGLIAALLGASKRLLRMGKDAWRQAAVVFLPPPGPDGVCGLVQRRNLLHSDQGSLRQPR
jgi:SOS response associated peptidase (SRAP)